MSVAYRTLKTVFQTFAPGGAKHLLFNGNTRLSKTILAVKGRLESSASHAEIYDANYYANYSAEMELSAVGIADSIIAAFDPGSVIDIGCGSGEVLAEFARRGITARGSDLSPASLAICRSKGLQVDCLDLETSSEIPDWSADVVISTEVAEHLAEAFADHYVALLSGMARRAIIITAAPPGQGGTDHVNEQPPAYWIRKFDALGVSLSEDLTSQFQRQWKDSGVEYTRSRNVLVFVKGPI